MSEQRTADVDERRARLRRALRENLKRRKAQARERAVAARAISAPRAPQNDAGRSR